MNRMRTQICIITLAGFAGLLRGQEADSGIDMAATVSANAFYSGQLRSAPQDGRALDGGVQSILYPTIKIGEHWSLTGAFETAWRPYDPDNIVRPGNGIRGRVIQAAAGYSRVWKNGSLIVRAGQLPSAFGSFMLRYDDAQNPLITAPSAYGYYYNPVTTIGLPSIQTDLTIGKWDARVQFANSSPANPRGIFDTDQYANWAGGAGYTVRQGLRIGASGFRGPYLDREFPYYFPGEAKPKDLPASGAGIDVDWAIGHWNVRGEWQRFVMTYKAIPVFRESDAYAEVRRVLTPRWFLAGRVGYLHSNALSGADTFEAVIGFRPDRNQILKTGYIVSHAQGTGVLEKTLLVQLVTTLHPFSLAWR
jgi:hypothetical protein